MRGEGCDGKVEEGASFAAADALVKPLEGVNCQEGIGPRRDVGGYGPGAEIKPLKAGSCRLARESVLPNTMRGKSR